MPLSLGHLTKKLWLMLPPPIPQTDLKVDEQSILQKFLADYKWKAIDLAPSSTTIEELILTDDQKVTYGEVNEFLLF